MKLVTTWSGQLLLPTAVATVSMPRTSIPSGEQKL